jgi:iron(III) transport system substrate-binding protein
MARRITVVTICVLISAFALASCGSGGDKLTVYSGRTEQLVKPLFEQFERESGIDLDVRYGDSADLAVLIDTEGDKGPDVFFSQSPGAIGFLDGKGRLVRLSDATLNQVPARFRASDGDWVGLSGRVRVIVFNADKIDEDDVPNSIFDFTDPKYKGRFGVAPPNGSFQDFITIMRSMRGDEATQQWLTAIRQNGARTYPNNIAIREAVERGEIDFGLVNHYYNEQAKAENPNVPTVNHFLSGDDPGAAILTTAVGILDTASEEKVADAEKLVAFLLSQEAQQYFANETFEYPLAAGVKPAGDLAPLDTITSPAIDLSSLGGGLQRTRELIRDSGLEAA